MEVLARGCGNDHLKQFNKDDITSWMKEQSAELAGTSVSRGGFDFTPYVWGGLRRSSRLCDARRPRRGDEQVAALVALAMPSVLQEESFLQSSSFT